MRALAISVERKESQEADRDCLVFAISESGDERDVLAKRRLRIDGYGRYEGRSTLWWRRRRESKRIGLYRRDRRRPARRPFLSRPPHRQEDR